MTILDNYGSETENPTLVLLHKYWLLYHLAFMTVVIGGEVFRRGTGIYLWDMDNIFAYFTLILFFVHMVFLDRVVNKNNWFRSIIYGGTSVIIIFAVF